MRALVTGGTGFLGHALLHRLASEGLELRVVHRPGRGGDVLDAVEAAHPGVVLERHPLALESDAEALSAALDGVDLVFHLAAAMGGGSEAVMRGTLAGSDTLLRALARQPTPPRVLLVGSLAVHGTADLPQGGRVDDDTPLEPHPSRRDAYTHAKLLQEHMFRDRCARGRIPLLVARPGVIYGPGRLAPSSRVGFGPFAGTFLLLGGDNPLPLVHVDNCAAALAWLARRGDFAGEACNIVDPAPPTCRAYLERYRARCMPGMRILRVPPRLGRRLARAIPWLHARSRGRVPLLLDPYRWDSSWRPLHYGSTRLDASGFVAPLPPEAAMSSAFAAGPAA